MIDRITEQPFCQTRVSGSTFVNADCFDVFPFIEDKSIDAIICDLPYGTTACKWDTIIPLEPLLGAVNFIKMLNLFQQKTATLFNGKKVKEGDKVYFINSDGERCEGLIQRRKFDVKLATPHYGTPRGKEPHKETTLKKGSLFFWNDGFLIEDYVNLDVVA